ncbi:flagellar biosynthesis anti-sigma factor FlgM [Thiomicrorhabdus sp. zzn3]|uniref:flagellar biosynthesis anti-sigma factor FlgM n=1 Tax=Thiomicrorhabdus sp. zzn3 TaxID=3039775 RepID=UPI0024373005|nr:flagellar biosynthesis anti-sigma factor FlgM [Thiomicrorhabdus sp. zzn3]MDG6777590.1 flagellar biosynthesis anti-sigma factor FlgM [Thiomicrorhabdus sp. zzn3]
MDIKNLNNNIGSGRAAEQVKIQERSAGTHTSVADSQEQSTDKVTLTSFLTEVRDLEQKADKVEVNNEDRIAALKAAIEDGSYQVNTQKIAERLIQSDALLATL